MAELDTEFHPELDPEQGWVAIPGLLSDDEVTGVLEVCGELLTQEPRVGDKPVAGTRHLVELDERSPLVDELLNRQALLEVVAAMLGADFHRFQVGYRSPQPTFGGQYLHADGMARGGGAVQEEIVTSIIALVPFAETNGATRLVPGSHRRPDLQRQSGSLDGHPDERLLTGQAGTAFVFSGHVLHSGTPNTSDEERPALQVLWHRGAGHREAQHPGQEG